MSELTFESILADPSLLASRVKTKTGLEVLFRPLEEGDGEILGRYFLSLSEWTKDRFAPHPFNQETADKLCQEEYENRAANRWFRMIGIEERDAEPPVIAYFILIFTTHPGEAERYEKAGIHLDPEHDCRFAPSVLDSLQGQGVGRALMQASLDIFRRADRRLCTLLGGVQQRNEQAIAFYTKHGFVKAGAFTTRLPNQDMYLKL